MYLFVILTKTVPCLSVLPQILPFDFGDGPINTGDVASLTCSVNKGDLPLNITWLFNGTEVRYSTHGVVTNLVNKRLSTLSIESVQASHAGSYSCKAQNKAGFALYDKDLYVNGTNHYTKRAIFSS